MSDKADTRTLTFTMRQVKDMLIGANYASPPISLARLLDQINIGLEEEWRRQNPH